MCIARIMRRWALVAASTIVAAGWGCSRQIETREAVARSRQIVVRNNGYFDVNVYAVPVGGASPIRIGTVTGLSSARWIVPEHLLQAGGTMVLALHAIGTGANWTSPSVIMDGGSVARLDIHTTATGDMSMSTLYVRANE